MVLVVYHKGIQWKPDKEVMWAKIISFHLLALHLLVLIHSSHQPSTPVQSALLTFLSFVVIYQHPLHRQLFFIINYQGQGERYGRHLLNVVPVKFLFAVSSALISITDMKNKIYLVHHLYSLILIAWAKYLYHLASLFRYILISLR